MPPDNFLNVKPSKPRPRPRRRADNFLGRSQYGVDFVRDYVKSAKAVQYQIRKNLRKNDLDAAIRVIRANSDIFPDVAKTLRSVILSMYPKRAKQFINDKHQKLANYGIKKAAILKEIEIRLIERTQGAKAAKRYIERNRKSILAAGVKQKDLDAKYEELKINILLGKDNGVVNARKYIIANRAKLTKLGLRVKALLERIKLIKLQKGSIKTVLAYVKRNKGKIKRLGLNADALVLQYETQAIIENPNYDDEKALTKSLAFLATKLRLIKKGVRVNLMIARLKISKLMKQEKWGLAIKSIREESAKLLSKDEKAELIDQINRTKQIMARMKKMNRVSSEAAIGYIKTNRAELEKFGIKVEELVKKIKLDKMLANGQIKEAIELVKKNRKTFGGKVVHKDVWNQVQAKIDAGKFDDAVALINEKAKAGVLPRSERDALRNYVRLFKALYEIKFIIKLKKTSGPAPGVLDVKKPLNDTDIVAILSNPLHVKIDSRTRAEQIEQAQIWLTGVLDENDRPYLSGGYDRGEIDKDTLMALYRFKQRNSPPSDRHQQAAAMVKALGSGKHIFFPWSQEDHNALRKAYENRKGIVRRPLNVVLAQTRLGSVVLAESGVKTINNTDFIWYMLEYLFQNDRAYLKTWRRLILGLITEPGKISAEQLSKDLLVLYRRAQKVKISKWSLKQILRKRPSSTRTKFPTVKMRLIGGGITVAEGAWTSTSAVSGTPRTYSLVNALLRAPIATFKRAYLASGGALISNRRGDVRYSNYFTKSDLLRMAAFMKTGSGLSIHYPLYNNDNLIKFIETKLNGNSKDKALAEKLLGNLLIFRAKKELARVNKEIAKEKAKQKPNADTIHKLTKTKTFLEKILRAKGDESRSVALRLYKNWKTSQPDKRLLRKMLMRKPIILTQSDVTRLISWKNGIQDAQVKDSLDVLIKGIRPNNLKGASKGEIQGLLLLAKRVGSGKLTYLDIVTLAHKNPGARMLLRLMKTMRAGAMELEGKKWYEVSPTSLGIGMAAKPPHFKLRFLKIRFAHSTGMIRKLKELRDKIAVLDKQIKTYHERAQKRNKPITEEEQTALSKLIGQRSVLNAKMDQIVKFIDGDQISPAFFKWFVSKFAKTGGTGVTGFLKGLGSRALSIANEFLAQISYRDQVTLKKMNLFDAMELLQDVRNGGTISGCGNVRLQDIPGWKTFGLFSLEQSFAGYGSLTNNQKKFITRVRQAMAAVINMVASYNTASKTPGLKIFGSLLANYTGLGSLFQESWQERLKMVTLSYYRYFGNLNPNRYIDALISGKVNNKFSKIDIQILKRILVAQPRKTPKIEGLIKTLDKYLEDSNAWDSNGNLKITDSRKDILKAIHDVFYKTDPQTGRITVGGPGFTGPAEGETWFQYYFPFVNKGFLKTVYANLPRDEQGSIIGGLMKTASSLPGEAAGNFLAQQILLRTAMPIYIYLGLPVDTIVKLFKGEGSFFKNVGHTALAFLQWPRVAMLWYRQMFRELEQGHVWSALAMFWAVNYITTRWGWSGIWGRTLTLDAEFFRILSKVPGAEKAVALARKWAMKNPKWYNASLRDGGARRAYEWLQNRWRTDGSADIVRNSRALRWTGTGLKYTGMSLLSPWTILGKAYNYFADNDTGSAPRTRRAMQGLRSGFNHSLDWPIYIMDVASQGLSRLADLRFRREIKWYQSRYNERLTKGERRFAKLFSESGGNFHFKPQAVTAEVTLRPDGTLAPTGQGSLRGNLVLKRFIESIPLYRSSSGLRLSVKYNDGTTTYILKDLKVVKVKVVSGSSDPRVDLRIPSGLVGLQNAEIILTISEGQISSGTVGAKLGSVLSGDIHVAKDAPPEALTGRPFDGRRSKAALGRLETPTIDILRSVRNSATFANYTWDTFRKASASYKAGKMAFAEYLKHITAAHRLLYNGTRILYPEQVKSLFLFDPQNLAALMGRSASGNLLLQMGTGQGKTATLFLGAMNVALKGQKAYIFTTNDDLVKQYGDDPTLRVLKQAGLKVGIIDMRDKAMEDPAARRRVYETSDVVIMTYAQHAYDISQGEIPRSSIKSGVAFCDEFDLPALNPTNYVTSGIKGNQFNPLLSALDRRRIRGKWQKAYKTFSEMLTVQYESNGRMKYFDLTTQKFTPEGLEFIKKSLKLKHIDSFTFRMFENLLTAQELYNENQIEGYKDRKRANNQQLLSERYNYIVKGGRIILLQGNTPSPNMMFGGGLDEALRTVYKFPLGDEHINLSEIGFKRLLEYHSRVIGASGTNVENWEVISKLYSNFKFEMVDLDSFIPEIRVTESDIKDPTARRRIIQRIIAEINKRGENGYTGEKDLGGGRKVKIRAKVVLNGIPSNNTNIKLLGLFYAELGAALRAIPGGDRAVSIINRHQRTLCKDHATQLRLAADDAVRAALEGRPVALSVQTHADVARVVELINQRIEELIKEDPVRYAGLKKKINVLKFTAEDSSPEAIEKLLKKAKEGGAILVNTRAGRGTDLGVEKTALFEVRLRTLLDAMVARAARTVGANIVKGGLHVVSVGPRTLAEERQQIGRSARGDMPGTTHTYLAVGDGVLLGLDKRTDAVLKQYFQRNGHDAVNLDGSPVEAPGKGAQPNTLERIVGDAFARSYDNNYKGLVGTFERDARLGPFAESYAQFSEYLHDGNQLFRKSFNTAIRYFLLDNTAFDGNGVFKHAEVAERLSRLMGGRKVDLSVFKGATRSQGEVIARAIADKLYSEFIRTYRGDLLLRDSAGAFPREQIMLRMMLGKRWGEFSQAVEELSNDQVLSRDKAALKTEIARRAKQMWRNIFSDIFEMAFPRGIITKTSLSQRVMNAARSWTLFKQAGDVDITITDRDVTNAKAKVSEGNAISRSESDPLNPKPRTTGAGAVRLNCILFPIPDGQTIRWLGEIIKKGAGLAGRGIRRAAVAIRNGIVNLKFENRAIRTLNGLSRRYRVEGMLVNNGITLNRVDIGRIFRIVRRGGWGRRLIVVTIGENGRRKIYDIKLNRGEKIQASQGQTSDVIEIVNEKNETVKTIKITEKGAQIKTLKRSSKTRISVNYFDPHTASQVFKKAGITENVGRAFEALAYEKPRLFARFVARLKYYGVKTLVIKPGLGITDIDISRISRKLRSGGRGNKALVIRADAAGRGVVYDIKLNNGETIGKMDADEITIEKRGKGVVRTIKFTSGSVSLASFSGCVFKGRIWKALIEAGYIDRNGVILPKFDGKRENFKLKGNFNPKDVKTAFEVMKKGSEKRMRVVGTDGRPSEPIKTNGRRSSGVRAVHFDPPTPAQVFKGIGIKLFGGKAFGVLNYTSPRTVRAFARWLSWGGRGIKNVLIQDGIEFSSRKELNRVLKSIKNAGKGNTVFVRVVGGKVVTLRLDIGKAKIIEGQDGTFELKDSTTGKKLGTLSFEDVKVKVLDKGVLTTETNLEATIDFKGVNKGALAGNETFIKIQQIEYLRRVRKLARKMGITEIDVAGFQSIGSVNAACKKAMKLFGMRHMRTGKMLKFIETQIELYRQGKFSELKVSKANLEKYIKWMSKQGTRGLVSMSAKSLVLGFIVMIGVEKLVELFKIKNPMLRFSIVLGSMHVATHALNPFLSGEGAVEAMKGLSNFAKTMIRPPKTLGKFGRIKYIGRGIYNVNWIAGLGNMLKGVAHGVVIARIYDGVLNTLKVKKNSTWRHPLVHMGAVFALQGAIGLGYQLGTSLLERTAAKSAASWVGRFAGRAALGLRAVGRVLGPVGVALGIANLADGLIFGGQGDFETTVNKMCYQLNQKFLREVTARGGWKGVGADLMGFGRFFSHLFFPTWSESRDAVGVVKKQVVTDFIMRSKQTRKGLVQFFRYHFTKHVAGNLAGGDVTNPNYYKRISVSDFRNDPAYLDWIDGIVRLPISSYSDKLGLTTDEIKRVRRGFAFLHFVKPQAVGYPSMNNDIRSMFNSDGTIKYSARNKFLQWFLTPAIKKAILKHRIRARMRYLVSEQRRYTDFLLKYIYKGKSLVYEELTKDEQSRWFVVRKVLRAYGILTHVGQTQSDMIKRFKGSSGDTLKRMIANCMHRDLGYGRLTSNGYVFKYRFSSVAYTDLKAGFIKGYKYRWQGRNRYHFGLVNTNHWAYKEYMAELRKRTISYVRRQFVHLGKRERRTRIAKMFLAVFLGKPGDKRVKDIKTQLVWLGYKLDPTNRKHKKWMRWMKWLNIGLKRVNRELNSGDCKKYLKLLVKIQRKVRHIKDKKLRSAAFLKELKQGLAAIGLTFATAARVMALIAKRTKILQNMGHVCEAAAMKKSTVLAKVERRVRMNDLRDVNQIQFRMIRDRQERQRQLNRQPFRRSPHLISTSGSAII